MSGFKDKDNIEAIRNRLYQRGTSDSDHVQHGLTDDKKEVPTSWDITKKYEKTENLQDIPNVVPDTYGSTVESTVQKVDLGMRKRRRGYRTIIALLGVAFFIIAILVSSSFLFFGRNTISGDNISIVLTTPFTVGGGEELPVQIGIQNNNGVPIQEAVLIIEYPQGTKSTDESPRDLFTERIPLETINPGETLNMPMRVVVFGEENAEKIISAAIEYRVQGSSARFFKEAPPQAFKISSAPVSFKVDGLKRISAGQETNLTITVVSNALTPLSEVLVKAEYPIGFEFSRATPAPESGKNTWLIKDVEPNSSYIITITGVMEGQDADTNVMHFSAGIPNERDKNSFATVFANASTEIEIEPAFIDIGVTVNGSRDTTVVTGPRTSISPSISINNTLQDSLYDLRVVVSFSGNAFVDSGISGTNSGFYDSTTRTLIWDVSQNRELEQLRPGGRQSFGFSFRPDEFVSTNPFVDLKVDVYARRVFERRVPEELIGSIERTVRINTDPQILASATHGNQFFIDSGPVPPVVGQGTTYTLSFRMENTTNDIRGARMSGTLPLYVTWLDTMTGDGTFEYNQTNRSVSWLVGDLEANSVAQASFQVSMLPSTSQIGDSPVLFSRQTMQATDTFTGRPVQASYGEITTRLSTETGFPDGNGIVQP